MAETKVGPAITSANIPRPVTTTVAQTAAKVATSAVDQIVAAPLIEPDFVNIKPNNPDVSFRWVLHTLYKKDGTQSILRFEQAKAQGYIVATKADIQPGCVPVAYERDNGTKYVNGDLILMKIDRRKYQGAILHREQQAAKQMLSTGREGKRMIQHELSSQPRSQTSKVSVFDPSQDLEKFAKEGVIDSLDNDE